VRPALRGEAAQYSGQMSMSPYNTWRDDSKVHSGSNEQNQNIISDRKIGIASFKPISFGDH
jgi:hypothetical protein